MKEYNRTTKKYVEVTDIKLKKRELCRGQREHDYVLVLPDHITYTEAYKFNPDAYYAILEEEEQYKQTVNEKLLALGIKSKYGSLSNGVTKTYICSVCKKKKYER